MDTLTTIEQLIETSGMDVPKLRRRDPRWLLRNLQVRNSGNPSCGEVLRLCTQVLRVSGR